MSSSKACAPGSGTLVGVDRGVDEGDFISIDLSATIDGEAVDEAATEACRTRSVPVN